MKRIHPSMEADVAIIGSGPAGLSAAIALASNGVKATVFDRLSEAGYERYHTVCGAGISRRTFRELRYLRESDILNTIPEALIRFPGGTDVCIRIGGAVIDRPSFLRRTRELCASLGCAFVRGRVASVRRSNDGFEVSLSDGTVGTFTHVIGCDGAFSVVRRCLFGSEPSYMVPAREFITSEKVPDRFELELSERYRGAYRWVFPSGDRCNTGSLPGASEPGEWIQSGGRIIPCGSVPVIEDDDAYLCGDAAGMANPVCFGGLSAALLSGQECAHAIVSGKKGAYGRWWRRCILSSRRFSELHDALASMSDEELARMAAPVGRFRSLWLSGICASLRHPKYIPMYIGCLITFRYGW